VEPPSIEDYIHRGGYGAHRQVVRHGYWITHTHP
jgi:hypothetical protein